MLSISAPLLYRSIVLSSIAILLAGPLVGKIWADDPAYLSAVADMPLPPGLVEDVEAGIVFDKPEGRIVEALARGAIEKSDVDGFYRAALPGLGWQKLTGSATQSRWQRGGEVLRVDIVDNGVGGEESLVVRFSIAPK